jgi:hypothetical protein
LTTFIDSSSDTLPKTTWRPSSHAASRRTGRARQGRRHIAIKSRVARETGRRASLRFDCTLATHQS